MVSLAALGVAVACSDATAPAVERSVTVTPKIIAMSAGQPVDIQVALRGFPDSTTISCRAVPDIGGTLITLARVCRFTVVSRAFPGTQVIASAGQLADTATIVVDAR
jgi:hypothetical protein